MDTQKKALKRKNGDVMKKIIVILSVLVLLFSLPYNKSTKSVHIPCNVYAQGKEKITPLQQACREGDIEKVKLLLQKNVDINSGDKDNWTPLHLAAFGGHTEIVELLIKKGANVNAKDRQSATPLHLAAFNAHRNSKTPHKKGCSRKCKSKKQYDSVASCSSQREYGNGETSH